MPQNVVELRQYTLHPGMRDTLIDLFDREFVESQEALGMTIIGQFRVAEDADRFVWLRGFSDMRTRASALADFYGGPVWQAHKRSANATMVDSDNVLLLRPARRDSGFSGLNRDRLPLVGAENPGRQISAAFFFFDSPREVEFGEHFENEIKPRLAESGASVLASFVTEKTPNNYPLLPIREGAHAFVAFATFEGPSSRWPSASEVWTLLPTARSRLR
jgi:hypothetical protein